MRLWSLHPKYLDTRGLVALWREALLAQAVLRGQTTGYTRHPQLARFRAAEYPASAVAAYLRGVHAEATRRGFRFDASRIGDGNHAASMDVTEGQLAYEWEHLVRKLTVRSPEWLATLPVTEAPAPHPLFQTIPGGIAEWEILRPSP